MHEKPEPGSRIMMEDFIKVLDEIYQARPEKPAPGEPVVLTDDELALYKERGQVTKHWRDGTMTILMTHERKAELQKLLGGR